MLSEEALGRLAEPLCSRINKVNSDFLEIIGKRIKEAGELLPSDVNRLQKMYEYGADMEAVVRELEKAAELNEKDIYKIFDKAGKDGYSYAKPFYKAAGLKFIPYEENEAIKKYVASLARQTAGAYKDFTVHSVFKVFGKSGAKEATSLSETYTRVIDEAVQAVTMGVDDYQSAMRRTVRALAQSGIKTADYASGYSRRLDTAVRQNLLYGLKECYNGIFEMTGKEFGADGYEIDYHSNPRPSHAEMGGRQYAIGRGRVVNGEYYPSIDEVQHLLDEYNCYHRKMPIILGISEPAYSAKELEGYKARDKEKIEYEGKEWTRYEGTQLQRKIETAIRHEKDKAIIAKAAGDETLQLEAQYRINALAYRYKELSDKFGLPTKAERLRVDGFKTKNIDNPVKSGIIKEQSRKNITIISERTIEKVPKVAISGYSNEQNIFIQQQHKELLKYAKDNNGSKEVAFVFDKEFKNRSEYIGSDKSLDFGMTLSGKGTQLFIMHNHPRNGGFSCEDIVEFVRNDNIKVLTIVKNSGGIEILNKSDNFNKTKIAIDLNRNINKIVKNRTDAEYNKAIEKWLNRNNGGFIEWMKKE